MMRLLISALLMLHALLAHADEGDLLEPEQAFKLSARALDAGTIEVRYQIANGYYLYREKFKFSAEPAGVTLGTAQFPAGKIKQDEYFGKVETYRQGIAIKLPVTLAAGSASEHHPESRLPGLRRRRGVLSASHPDGAAYHACGSSDARPMPCPRPEPRRFPAAWRHWLPWPAWAAPNRTNFLSRTRPSNWW